MVKSYAYRKIFSDNACTNDLTDEVTKLLALKKADGKSLVITRMLINLQMKLWNLLKADEGIHTMDTFKWNAQLCCIVFTLFTVDYNSSNIY